MKMLKVNLGPEYNNCGRKNEVTYINIDHIVQVAEWTYHTVKVPEQVRIVEKEFLFFFTKEVAVRVPAEYSKHVGTVIYCNRCAYYITDSLEDILRKLPKVD